MRITETPAQGIFNIKNIFQSIITNIYAAVKLTT